MSINRFLYINNYVIYLKKYRTKLNLQKFKYKATTNKKLKKLNKI
jgi:hypothetical protein